MIEDNEEIVLYMFILLSIFPKFPGPNLIIEQLLSYSYKKTIRRSVKLVVKS